MQFQKYCSIDEKSRSMTLEKYMVMGYTSQDWVVTTKIHGSNFSVSVGKDDIQFSRRTGVLAEGEKFFNYQKVMERHSEKIQKVRDLTISEFGLESDCVVQIFGEIFGGVYPHPDVPRVEGVSKVQKEVYYCPDVDFFPFDIYVRKSDEESFPVDHDVFERIISGAGFGLYAKALLTGSFEECLAYPNDYSDPIHKFYGLPEIEGNICEGNVLKPVKAICEMSGSRVILKNKNSKFKERSDEPREKKSFDVSDEAQNVLDLSGEYINENRLRNVVSHLGEVTQKDFPKLLGSFSQDVQSDMVKDDPEVFDNILSEERKIVSKMINNSCAIFIRKYFVNIIDGMF